MHHALLSQKEGRKPCTTCSDRLKYSEKTGDEFMGNNAKNLIKECSREFGLNPEDCRTLG